MKKYILAWLLMAVFDYGAYFGDIQGHEREQDILYPALSNGYPERHCRSDMASAAGFGVIGSPVFFVLSPFITGFYQHGFKWSCP